MRVNRWDRVYDHEADNENENELEVIKWKKGLYLEEKKWTISKFWSLAKIKSNKLWLYFWFIKCLIKCWYYMRFQFELDSIFTWKQNFTYFLANFRLGITFTSPYLNGSNFTRWFFHLGCIAIFVIFELFVLKNFHTVEVN